MNLSHRQNGKKACNIGHYHSGADKDSSLLGYDAV